MQRVVLVVDDSADLRVLMKLYLETEGFAVVTAKDGQDAIDQLQQGLRPCVIFLDMIMAGMDGPEFLRTFETQMADLFSTTPIIATSAMDKVPMGKVAAFLPKPVDVDRLVQTVQAHCGT